MKLKRIRPIPVLLWTFCILVACFALLGCGQGPQPLSTEESLTINPAQEGPISTQFYNQCVVLNEPLIESRRVTCISGFYGTEAVCNENAAANAVKLQNTYEQVKLSARATLQECIADFRISSDQCYAQYEQDLTYRLYECQGAAVWF